MRHAHAAIWKERGHLTTQGSSIKYGDQNFWLLEAVHLPVEVSISCCKGHQKGIAEVARENQAASQAAERAALQNSDLLGVATLLPPTNSDSSSYTEGETLKAKNKNLGRFSKRSYGVVPKGRTPFSAWEPPVEIG